MKTRTTICSLVAVLFMVSQATAGSIPSGPSTLLSDLLDGGSLVVGDKTFAEFTYNATGDMPPASAINVIPIIDDEGDLGIRFQGGFIDTVGGGASDSLITFSVTAPGAYIMGAELAGNVDVANGGVATVTETFLPEDTLSTLTITSGVKLADATLFGTPVQTLNVQKDILLLADSAPATLSFVDQTFPQVPEPATGLMAIFGVLGLLGVRRGRG